MTIAILAHDSRKELALQFCTAYSAILSRNNVIATGTTGRMLAQTTGLPVHCYLSGKLGGVQQITSRVACDEVDLVLFFRDPLKADAASLTEQNLLRLCDMHSVPIATNIATAEVLLRGLDQGRSPPCRPVPCKPLFVCYFVYRGKKGAIAACCAIAPFVIMISCPQGKHYSLK